MLLRAAGNPAEPRLRALPAGMLRALGVFSPGMRAIGQAVYPMPGPFIVDDSDTRELLGVDHTPLEETVAAIVAAHGAGALPPTAAPAG